MVDVFDRHEVRFDPRLTGCSRFVRHSDYAALEAQLTERVDERSKVRDSLINWLGGVHSLKSRLAGRSRTSLYPHQSLYGELLERSEGMLEETIDMTRKAIDALTAALSTPPAPEVTEAIREFVAKQSSTDYDIQAAISDRSDIYLTAAQEADR